MYVQDDNPYASPQADDSGPQLPRQLGPWQLAAGVGIGVLGGMLLGAAVNMINGAVSPEFFRRTMGWNDQIWLRSVLLGAIEGSLYGAIYGMIFVAIIALVTERRCPFRRVRNFAYGTIGLTFAFWCIGGMVAVGWVRWFPQWAPPRWTNFPADAATRAQYAWGAGCYFAAVYGGLVAVVLSNAYYVLKYRITNPHE